MVFGFDVVLGGGLTSFGLVGSKIWWGFALLGIGAHRMCQNSKPEENINKVHQVHQNLSADPLTRDGAQSQVSRTSQKHFDRSIGNKRVVKNCSSKSSQYYGAHAQIVGA
eukprot:gnl/MRDRNA2_/MRDRNA2_14909_c0_seq1.p1 gnl/MRDRNA2_/MRDRNA2_14909_c0~~gnl/MRDRNA2_/MRDRNA2_14909_c0_seq1.p1  ORF type:complete len:110 (+),score=17.91 gnl/MRDRNA2_/MRDRNA2_14909_c0_seq1:67-396(+)